MSLHLAEMATAVAPGAHAALLVGMETSCVRHLESEPTRVGQYPESRTQRLGISLIDKTGDTSQFTAPEDQLAILGSRTPL
jgi:hypothetical protein